MVTHVNYNSEYTIPIGGLHVDDTPTFHIDKKYMCDPILVCLTFYIKYVTQFNRPIGSK